MSTGLVTRPLAATVADTAAWLAQRDNADAWKHVLTAAKEREILAARPFRKHLEIPPERHALFIVMKEVRHARRRGAMGAEKLRFLGFAGKSQDEVHSIYFPQWPANLSPTIFVQRLLLR